jgi:starch synthase
MKVALSAIGKFHTFDLAREMLARDSLVSIATAYPKFKLKNESIPDALIKTFPWIYTTYLAMPMKDRWPLALRRGWENFAGVSFDAWVAANLPECDVYVGLSGAGLAAGETAQRRGARYVCDRGSSHIREQDELLREEHKLWGIPFSGIDPRLIEREEAEYEQADAITVPSQFSLRSFVKRGVPQEKIRVLPYGVNLTKFQPVARPDDGRFDILFVGGMSLRKGIQYLTQAYQRLKHPQKSLTFVGTPSQAIIDLLNEKGMWADDTRVLGHMPQHELKNLMSRSHVLVLPSIEDGFGLVQAQAMACGCPVIASMNTGGEDLFSDGIEGYTVPIRSVDALHDRLQSLADMPEVRQAMSERAIAKVRAVDGWRGYGDKAHQIFSDVISAS